MDRGGGERKGSRKKIPRGELLHFWRWGALPATFETDIRRTCGLQPGDSVYPGTARQGFRRAYFANWDIGRRCIVLSGRSARLLVLSLDYSRVEEESEACAIAELSVDRRSHSLLVVFPKRGAALIPLADADRLLADLLARA